MAKNEVDRTLIPIVIEKVTGNNKEEIEDYISWEMFKGFLLDNYPANTEFFNHKAIVKSYLLPAIIDYIQTELDNGNCELEKIIVRANNKYYIKNIFVICTSDRSYKIEYKTNKVNKLIKTIKTKGE